MAKEPSFVAKAMGMTRRLQYNFNSTALKSWWRSSPSSKLSSPRPHNLSSGKHTDTLMADTTSITDKIERKKIKRAARKAAPPKAKRTGARGENKAKIKKAARGKSKR